MSLWLAQVQAWQGLSWSEVLQRDPSVIQGEVLSVKGPEQHTPEGTVIAGDIRATVRVDTWLKGEGPDSVVLVNPWETAPQFQTGETIIALVRPTATGGTYTVLDESKAYYRKLVVAARSDATVHAGTSRTIGGFSCDTGPDFVAVPPELEGIEWKPVDGTRRGNSFHPAFTRLGASWVDFADAVKTCFADPQEHARPEQP